MTKPPKDLKIVVGPKARAKIDADPGLAKAMTELYAAFHQAAHGVQTGQYKSFEDAMEAITGQRPERVEDQGQEEDPE